MKIKFRTLNDYKFPSINRKDLISFYLNILPKDNLNLALLNLEIVLAAYALMIMIQIAISAKSQDADIFSIQYAWKIGLVVSLGTLSALCVI